MSASLRCRPKRIAPRQAASLCLVLATGLLASCAHHARKVATSAPAAASKLAPVAGKPAAPLHTIEAIPTTPEQRLGTVRVIGAHGSFVLIETPSAAATAAVPTGRLIHCRAPGLGGVGGAAELRVSPERRQPFLVADVLNGTPSVGDVAYLPRDSPPLVIPFRPGTPIPPPVPAAASPPSPEPTPNP